MSPTRIQHLVDARAGWEQRAAITQLTANLPPGRFQTRLLSLDGGACSRLRYSGLDVTLLPRRAGPAFLTAPVLRCALRESGAEIIHAWSADAAAIANQADGGAPILLELFDPRISDKDARMLRLVQQDGRLTVACAGETVRRRLIEKGISPESCVVIRPGVDFRVLNAARKKDVRAQLGVETNDRLLLTAEPAVRGGGQYAAYWLSAVRYFLKPARPERIVVPGTGAEVVRIQRLASQLGLTEILRCPSDTVPFEELITHADALLMPSRREVSTTPMAWAMAAGVPVLASAVYATAELIGHKLNGLLVKPDVAKRMAVAAAPLLDDHASLNKAAETARGQAFQVFSVRHNTDQHARLYENLTAGRNPAEGLKDAAVDAG